MMRNPNPVFEAELTSVWSVFFSRTILALWNNLAVCLHVPFAALGKLDEATSDPSERVSSKLDENEKCQRTFACVARTIQ
jgi:hypothetical protein